LNHAILLQIGVGLTDPAIKWISSFLSERTQQIAYNGDLSSKQPVLLGISKGSILEPSLYVLYTL